MSKFCILLVLAFFAVVEGEIYDSDTISDVTPNAVLFYGFNQTGVSKVLPITYFPNLASKDFENRARSACVNGTWLFYNKPNYNDGFKDAEMEYISGQRFCSNFKHVGGKVSSLRFVGSSVDYTSDSITFYAGQYFQGKEEFFTESAKSLAVLTNMTQSLIVTGTEGWTMYDKADYKGTATCIKPYRWGNVSHPTKFVPDTNDIKIPHGTIKSVRLGCKRF